MTNRKMLSRARQPLRGKGKVPLTYYRSASSKSDDGKSPFNRRKTPGKLKKVLLGTLDILVIGLLLLGFFYSLIVAPLPSISASSYKYRSNNTYQQAAEGQLKTISNRNKLSIKEEQIIKNLQSEFPEIESGSVELPIVSQKPKIHLAIAEPSFVLLSGGSRFIIASNGVVAGNASDFSRLNGLPEVEDQSGFKLQIGSPAFSSTSAKFIATTWKSIENAGVDVDSMILPPLPMELNLRTKDKSYFVKFDMGGDVALQTGQFLAARQQFEKDGTTPTQYLDARVKGKIFYK